MTRIVVRLSTPLSGRAAAAVTISCGLILLLLLDRTAAMRSEQWQVDEGQRIAESYFLRLLLEGEFAHPDWFRNITDSSHPQMSKYFFGLAVRLAGVELPRDLALPRYYEQGGLERGGWQPPPHLMPVYRPMLQPARRAALLCNVISWMAVTWLLLRWMGPGAALLAAFVFARHYLPVMLYAHARSDALQTCAFTLTLLPLAAIWRGTARRWSVAAACASGLFAAIAFQTRVNGLLAMGAAAVVLLVLAVRTRDRRPIVLVAVMTLTCAVAAVVSNPYYWAQPRDGQGLRAACERDEALPLRVASRFRTQVADLQLLLHGASYAALPSLPDRACFLGRVLFSGVAGMLLLGGFIAAVAMLFVPAARASLLLPCTWSISAIAVFTLWLPLSWEPYVLMIFPTAVLFATTGWAAAARHLFIRERA